MNINAERNPKRVYYINTKTNYIFLFTTNPNGRNANNYLWIEVNGGKCVWKAFALALPLTSPLRPLIHNTIIIIIKRQFNIYVYVIEIELKPHNGIQLAEQTRRQRRALQKFSISLIVFSLSVYTYLCIRLNRYVMLYTRVILYLINMCY